MARANRTWGEERIAAELPLKTRAQSRWDIAVFSRSLSRCDC